MTEADLVQISFDTPTMRALTRSAGFAATKDLAHIQSEHPVRRELVWKENRERPANTHPLYPPAIELQLRGNANNPPCNSCARGAGPFANGCVSFHQADAADNGGKVPFIGACANCYWGGQGPRCSLRVGGRTFSLLVCIRVLILPQRLCVLAVFVRIGFMSINLVRICIWVENIT